MSLKVLLADDSMTAQNMGKKILTESGYDVTTVSNGAAAVKKIAEVKPDLVILDIYMPGYTGLEVCERVRANFDTANLPVLLTVGKMEPYRAEDGAKVRADGVIIKPFEATDLLALVKKISEKAAPENGRRAPKIEEPVEEEPQQESHQAESTLPAQVDVPAEMAIAPALTMDEFDTSAPVAAPAAEWNITETPVVQPATTESPTSEIPWAFDASPVAEATTPAEVSPEAALEVPMSAQTESASALEPAAEEFTSHLEGDAPPASEAVIAEPAVEAPAEVSWNGWVAAPEEAAPETASIERTEEPKAETSFDDFEAKVAAAMSGFSTEPVEPEHTHSVSDISSGPADDFEAKVAAAMSGFATEPVQAATEPFQAADVHETAPEPETAATDDFEARVAAAMAGFGGADSHSAEPEPAPASEFLSTVPEGASVYASENTAEEPVPSEPADDFEAKLAQAMSAFDIAPAEIPVTAPVPGEETQELEPIAAPKPSINLDETTVLPQEALLSLEEEMNRALAKNAVPEPQAVEDVSFSAELEPSPVPELEVEPNLPTVEANATPELVEAVSEAEPPAMETAPEPPVAQEQPSKDEAGSEKLAGAVQRAIERLKPQLIAEIVKELKGE